MAARYHDDRTSNLGQLFAVKSTRTDSAQTVPDGKATRTPASRLLFLLGLFGEAFSSIRLRKVIKTLILNFTKTTHVQCSTKYGMDGLHCDCSVLPSLPASIHHRHILSTEQKKKKEKKTLLHTNLVKHKYGYYQHTHTRTSTQACSLKDL